MRIGIDARALTQHPTSGVALYTREMIDALRRIASDELVLFTQMDVPHFLRRLPIVGNHLAFARVVDRAEVDVFFSPTGLLPLGLKTPSVAFIHDVIMLKHPEWFPDSGLQRAFTLRWTLPSTIRRARCLLVPSTIVRDDLGRLFPETKNKTHVTPEGVRVPAQILPLADEQRRRWEIAGKYLLSVGTLEPRKNVEAAITAFAAIAQGGEESLQLVLIGSEGWGAVSILKKIDEVNQQFGRQAVCYLGAVSEEDKWTLYQNAEMLLALSHDEGFYLPPFEALSVGTSVIATPVGAIPDLVADAVNLVEPGNADQMSQSILRLLNQKSHRVIEPLTWETAAQQTLKVLRDAAC